MRCVRTGLVCLVTMAPSIAAAQMVDPAFPRSVVQAIQDLGYRAALETDTTGDPKIRSSIEGADYTIWFYGCRTDGTRCEALHFSSGYDLTVPLTLAEVNDWNRDKLVGRTYVAEDGAAYIDYYVEAKGGVPRPAFAEVLRMWGVAVADFHDLIDW
ncbi:YbjN domain-containing protein [Rhodosalinus sediminis]|uniref:YbjN domain-containing protein n=1 Tax=Rhodosalinus sediminis TaxID=1940533 RepID=UPI002353B562|nr:YbjN domain-containing protein [Rhodosalinus sediminis]